MSSLIDADNEENKKAKGVNKNVVNNIRHKEYIVLFNKKIIQYKMKTIQCKLHRSVIPFMYFEINKSLIMHD